MWSPTKLDFSFYDFPVIYYDFSKIQRKSHYKRTSFLGDSSSIATVQF
jgi:hypothetical protein